MNQSSDAPKTNGASHTILIGILIAIVLGILIGGFAPSFGLKLAVLGEIFLNALKMIVVPLVMLSMIVGITSLGDVRKIGGIGSRTIIYYMATTGLSVLVGIILVNIVQPGKGMSPGEEHADVEYRIEADGRTVRLVGASWERARFEQYKGKFAITLADQGVQGDIEAVTGDSATVKFWKRIDEQGVINVTASDGTTLPFRRVEGRLVSAEPEIMSSGTGVNVVLPVASKVSGKEGRTIGATLKEVVVGMVPSNVFKSMAEMDVLPLIVFSLLLGAVLTVLGDVGRPAIQIVTSLNEAVMKLVHWLMYLAPVGILGLLAGRIGLAGGFEEFLPELAAVGKYFLTVLVGLLIHGFITLPLILLLIGKRNPWKFFLGMAKALLNAFSTASSSATLPLTMEGVEDGNGISTRTSSFVLPLGATINMDGTALYEAVGAMFIAQIYAGTLGIHIGPAEQIVIFLTATLAAIGAAGIPEAGLVTMVIVLKAVDLPIEGITLILTVDWLLDRFRTTVNVWGDSVGAGVIETLELRDQSPEASAA